MPSSPLSTLRAQAPALRAAGVAALYLYGSAARGESTPASDIDLFLDQAEPERFTLLDLIALREHLEAALGAPVDLSTRASLHPALRPAIEADAIRVF
jgi:predicted nucleotidyltransferase